jgi:hypothetical protein
MNHTTTVLIAIAALTATLLAAGTVAAAVGSSHSAFAHKEYKNKYHNNNKYAREDKSGRDGDNINVGKQNIKCIVVGHDDGMTRPGTSQVTPVEDGHAIGPNSCNATQDFTNNDGTTVTPPPTSTCVPSTIADQKATPTDGTCTAIEDGASNSAFIAACTAAKGTTSGNGANTICTFPSTRA